MGVFTSYTLEHLFNSLINFNITSSLKGFIYVFIFHIKGFIYLFM